MKKIDNFNIQNYEEESISYCISVFVQLFYGQEKYTIQGEFPDNSLDGKYIILTDKSFSF